LRRRILLTFLLLVVMLTAVMLSKWPRSDATLNPALTEARARWESQGASHYRMTLVTSALPSPPTALELTVRDGEIVQERIISCENPSAEYPAEWCEPTQRYYTSRGRYTIEQLFETADICTQRTLISMSRCPAYISPAFHGFTSVEAMSEAIQTCQSYLRSVDTICAVSYDPASGYPAEIWALVYRVFNGSSSISVRAFEIIVR
jgi:hypothetical protein